MNYALQSARDEFWSVTSKMLWLKLISAEDADIMRNKVNIISSEDEIKTMQLDLILAVSEERRDARFYDELNKFLPKELRKNTMEGKIVEYTNFSKQEDTRFGYESWTLYKLQDGTFASYGGDPMEWEGWCDKYQTIEEAMADGFTED